MKTLIYILTVLSLTACFNSSDKSNEVDNTFQVNYVDSLIDDGCFESCTYDSVPLEKKKFIFTSDRIETANIKIDNKEIYLKHDTLYKTKDNKYVEIWKSNSWTVEVKTYSTKQTCDECGYSKGTITIKSGDKIKVIKMHSESGC